MLLDAERAASPPEPTKPKKKYRYKRSQAERCAIAKRSALARIPTTPHPDNVAAFNAAYPDGLGGDLHAFLEGVRKRCGSDRGSWYAWAAWRSELDRLGKLIADFDRRPRDQVISRRTIRMLRAAKDSLDRDLKDAGW